MREIKFRSWSKTYSCMIIVEHIDFYADRLSGVLSNNKKPVVQPNPIKKGVLMQYTGLKDKNGKELYENDLCSNASRNSGLPIEIVFDCGCFMGRYIDKGFLFHLQENELSEMEVIGNIYEHASKVKGDR